MASLATHSAKMETVDRTKTISTSPMIKISNVGKRYRDIRGMDVIALKEFSLSVFAKEFVSILGPSGCGKSTMLNMIAGFETPSVGEILLDAEPIRGPDPDRSVVFQEYSLFPWLSVEQNIGFGLRNKVMPAAEKQEIVRKLVELVKLDGFTHSYPRELSGGMKQRVGIARALAIDPKILLMDEPFAALDALTRQEMQEQLLEIRERTHKTIVFVTHSIEEALYLSDRVVVMSRRPGKILKTIEVVMSRPRDISCGKFNDYRRLASDIITNEIRRKD